RRKPVARGTGAGSGSPVDDCQSSAESLVESSESIAAEGSCGDPRSDGDACAETGAAGEPAADAEKSPAPPREAPKAHPTSSSSSSSSSSPSLGRAPSTPLSRGRSGTRGPAIVVTTFELVLRDAQMLREAPAGKWGALVIDEGHKLKGAASKLAAALATISAEFRLLLTGTPLQNNLKELWALLDFVLPGFFDGADSFERWFAAPFKGRAGATAPLSKADARAVLERLHAVLRPVILRRTKAQLRAELPPLIQRVIAAPPSAPQWMLSRLVSAGIGDVPDPVTGRQTRVSLINRAMLLRRIDCHPFLLGFSATARFSTARPGSEGPVAGSGSPAVSASGTPAGQGLDPVRSGGKAEVLCRSLGALARVGHRALVFSQFTDCLDAIEMALEAHPASRRLRRLRIDGSTPSEDRDAAMAEFAKRSGPEVMLLSTRAGGVGITLTAADTIIIFDSDWNPQNDLQAIARAHRIGQTKSVLVLRMVASGVAGEPSVEQGLLREAERKRTMERAVMQGLDDVAGVEGSAKPVAARVDAPSCADSTFTLQAALGVSPSKQAVLDGQGVDDASLAASLARSDEDLKAVTAALAAIRRDCGGLSSLLSDGEAPSGLTCAAVEARLQEASAAEDGQLLAKGLDSSNILPEGAARRRSSPRAHEEALAEEAAAAAAAAAAVRPAKRPRKRPAPKKPRQPAAGAAEEEKDEDEDEDEVWDCPFCQGAASSFEELQLHVIVCDEAPKD
ncbi:snf22, partial [Symbiodinium sp. KB8]